MFLFSSAFAQTAGTPATSVNDLFSMFFPLLLVMGVFWFFILRPQQKKMKDHQALLKAVRRGDTVVVGGMIGKVHRVVDEAEILVEFCENVRIKVLRNAISDVRSKGEPVKDGSDKSLESDSSPKTGH